MWTVSTMTIESGTDRITDEEEVRRRLAALISDGLQDRVLFVVHEGQPLPMDRPRFGQGRTFTSARSREAKRSVAWEFLKTMNRAPRYEETLAIVALFYRQDRRAVDVDNLMKLVMDAATKAKVWKDDSQVIAQAAILDYDKKRPRTVVALCPYSNALSMAAAPLFTKGRR